MRLGSVEGAGDRLREDGVNLVNGLAPVGASRQVLPDLALFTGAFDQVPHFEIEAATVTSVGAGLTHGCHGFRVFQRSNPFVALVIKMIIITPCASQGNFQFVNLCILT